MTMLLRLGSVSLLGAGLLFADFTYEETTKITGGAMAGVLKVAGAFSKEAREPMHTTISVQGDRMARISEYRGEVIDLDKETITAIDFRRKTYSVVTFAQMRQAMADMQQKMKDERAKQPQGDQANVDFKADVKDLGQQKEVSGLPAHEMLLNLVMSSTDPKTNQQGNLVVTSDMWLAPGVQGAAELRSFQKRMAEKLAFSPGAGLFAAGGGQQNADLMKGMAALYKQAATMDGLPVLTDTRMGMNATGEPLPAAPVGSGPSVGDAAKESAKNTATESATSAALGRLGGMAGGLGGLGGFGRKKKQEASNNPPTQAQGANAQQTSGVLIETETQLTNFSSAPADPSRFQVPAGFKQVEPEIERRGRH